MSARHTRAWCVWRCEAIPAPWPSSRNSVARTFDDGLCIVQALSATAIHLRTHGVVVSHPLRMRKALGSNPSVSRFHIKDFLPWEMRACNADEKGSTHASRLGRITAVPEARALIEAPCRLPPHRLPPASPGAMAVAMLLAKLFGSKIWACRRRAWRAAPVRRAHGVVVSHPLRMRKALGSNPSVSIVQFFQAHA